MVKPTLIASAAVTRGFSTETGLNKLTRALTQEIKYEKENYGRLGEIDTFLKESGFALTEEADGI